MGGVCMVLLVVFRCTACEACYSFQEERIGGFAV
uniref:Uncharacterized protein n=1 Tax=Anguilla anguilla TaxID=7936 RepID=A0A0E9W3E7_ANGAN